MSVRRITPEGVRGRLAEGQKIGNIPECQRGGRVRGKEGKAEHGGAGGWWVRWNMDRPETGDVPQEGRGTAAAAVTGTNLGGAKPRHAHSTFRQQSGSAGAQPGCDGTSQHALDLTSSTNTFDLPSCWDRGRGARLTKNTGRFIFIINYPAVFSSQNCNPSFPACTAWVVVLPTEILP